MNFSASLSGRVRTRIQGFSKASELSITPRPWNVSANQLGVSAILEITTLGEAGKMDLVFLSHPLFSELLTLCLKPMASPLGEMQREPLS